MPLSYYIITYKKDTQSTYGLMYFSGKTLLNSADVQQTLNRFPIYGNAVSCEKFFVFVLSLRCCTNLNQKQAKKTHFTLLDPRKHRSMMHPAAAIIEKSHTHPATEHVMRYDEFACVMAMAECVSGRCR